MNTTTYLGMTLRSPLVASAGPLAQTVPEIQELADTGLGAIVLHSLFEEQLASQAMRDLALEELSMDSFAEASSYFPDLEDAPTASPARAYLSLLERAAKAVEIPVIASLNATGLGSWVDYATQLADAGAAALECNIYFVPGDLTMSGSEVEARQLEIVAAVKQAVSIPVAVKLSPYFSSVGNFALQVIDAGADGLVLFNRFIQPWIDTEEVAVKTGVSLSSPASGKMPRTWIARLRNQTSASLAGSSGVESPEDVVAYLLAGADVVMTTSALVRHGAGYASKLLDGVHDWMARKEFATVADFRGLLAVPADDDGAATARAGYVAALRKASSTYGSLRGSRP